MNLGWQDIIAMALVFAAAVYLRRRLRRAGTCGGSEGCRSCASCASTGADGPLLTIDGPSTRSPPGR